MTKAHETIPWVQYLDENAELTQPLPGWAEQPEILVDYYEAMVFARQADQKAVALQRTGKMGTYPSCLGQEAQGVVYGKLLESSDVFVPYYRDHPAMVARGVRYADIYRYWGGDEIGSASEGYGQDFPNCVPIATQAPHAAGIASAFKLRGEDRVVLTTCGDGATSKGDFLESLNLAGAWQLPVVYFINNNQWAISVPRSIQCGAPTLAQKGVGAGLHCVQVDGNDVIALHEVVSAALDRARHKRGATVIEAISYRLSDHTTADDAGRYRPSEELREAWEKEPIKRLRDYLHGRGHWGPEKETALQERVAKQVQEEVDAYQSTPLPTIDDLFDYHYANTPKGLAEQKEEMKLGGLGHD
ncbi:pyruvate dehydrogenase (acetyl-transferring) E1 component subunit alpha [Kistimonas scapharcae]|uniref:Pyruvate dehydrogenase E1 component subunit alpha n=1 Tax=Kistimonas scapharcae TaxID=1036133 RepID=A0ABP8V6T9_9GAMM